MSYDLLNILKICIVHDLQPCGGLELLAVVLRPSREASANGINNKEYVTMGNNAVRSDCCTQAR